MGIIHQSCFKAFSARDRLKSSRLFNLLSMFSDTAAIVLL